MSGPIDERFEGLTPYTPGEQPKDKSCIKLNTNESPYPPSRLAARRVAAEISDLALYPDPRCGALKAKLADMNGVKEQNIFVSNGSDETLSFLFMAFCDGGAVFPDITYGFYKVFARLYGVKYREIPLKDDFTVDVCDYAFAGGSIFIANPNAPTGICLSPEEIEGVAASNPGHRVVVDEAYIAFGGQSCAGLTGKYENIVVVRTFSKSHSLAGGRIGYAIAHEKIIAGLEKIKYSTNPYNVNRMSQAAALAALEDNGYYLKNAVNIMKTREFTRLALTDLGFFCVPSRANFIFAKHEKINGQDLYTGLREKGVLVRRFPGGRTEDFIRVSIGAPEDMKRFIISASAVLTEEKR